MVINFLVTDVLALPHLFTRKLQPRTPALQKIHAWIKWLTDGLRSGISWGTGGQADMEVVSAHSTQLEKTGIRI